MTWLYTLAQWVFDKLDAIFWDDFGEPPPGAP